MASFIKVSVSGICAGEVADLLDMSEQEVVEHMLKHALPPLVEAGNKSALEVLAGKIGSDPQNLLQNYGHTIIAKCLYEGAQYTLPVVTFGAYICSTPHGLFCHFVLDWGIGILSW